MQWYFAYGLSIDPDRMHKEVGSWEGSQPASLPDYVYLFTGSHPDIQGGSSTVVPLTGGVVLGVAYRLTDQQVQNLVAPGHGYILRESQALLGTEMMPVMILQPQEVGPPTLPSDAYLGQVRRGLAQHYPEKLVELYLNRALQRTSGRDLVQRKLPTPDTFRFEYGCDFRRLFPWADTGATFGAAWAVVTPGQTTTPHGHEEEETFIFLIGEGLMSVDGQTFPVRKGDVVYLAPFAAHTVRNTGNEPLELLCIWWGGVSPAPAPLATAIDSTHAHHTRS
jgi:mannose-6-phosphate isomerase-like protein (cupin superfamily)